MSASHHDLRARAETFGHDERIPSAERRFDSITFDELDRSALAMPDPQQPEWHDEANVIMGTERVQVMVEPMVFPTISRERPIAIQPDLTPPPPDPVEVARQLVAEARSTARTMLAQAREVIAADRASAIEQGYAEGFATGQAEADAETAGLMRTCERIGIHVMEERERVLAENEADIVELAISIARRIVNASIDVDETLVVEACRGAMRKAFQRGSMQVLAHPDDLGMLRDAGPELANELGGIEHMDFIEERRLDRGSVIVRTPAGEIDATVDGKAARIEQALREGIEARRAERRAGGA
jgi:flagellar biosynthesis/type III secretory pathway protein FliH